MILDVSIHKNKLIRERCFNFVFNLFNGAHSIPDYIRETKLMLIAKHEFEIDGIADVRPIMIETMT